MQRGFPSKRTHEFPKETRYIKLSGNTAAMREMARVKAGEPIQS